MRRTMLAACCFAMLAGAAIGAPPATPDLKAIGAAFSELADGAMPSTVALRVYKVLSEPDARVKATMALGHGSGFAVADGGFILTNHHVVAGADEIIVILHDGTFLEAALIAADRRSDLAVLQIEAQIEPLRVGGQTRAGRWIFAVGNPKGIARSSGRMSFTWGTVSAVGRDMTRILSKDGAGRYYGNMIEADISVHPGSSGGPLLNADGEVVGIVSAMSPPEKGRPSTAAYAIPLDRHAMRVVAALLDGKEVEYGFLGVEIAALDLSTRKKLGLPRPLRGALVTAAYAGLPAEAAGLVAGDVITAFEGRPIAMPNDLVLAVGATPVGSVVRLDYWRGEALSVNVALARREVE